MRSALTTRIKEAMFSVFGESQLDSINTTAIPGKVAEWKASRKTRDCYQKLFTPISNDSTVTYMQKILTKVWSGTTPSNTKMAYAITVCQIMLSDRYDKLTISEDFAKSRLKKNLVRI
jgi:hypothetical protein